MPEYEQRIFEEIYGCVKYIGIPYETVMSMPVYERKSWITRHNIEQQELLKNHNKGHKGSSTVTGEGINAFAGLTQKS